MKVILINKCDDPQMWYADKVGQTVRFVLKADSNGDLTSIDGSGHLNIVKEADCTVIDVFDPEEPA